MKATREKTTRLDPAAAKLASDARANLKPTVVGIRLTAADLAATRQHSVRLQRRVKRYIAAQAAKVERLVELGIPRRDAVQYVRTSSHIRILKMVRKFGWVPEGDSANLLNSGRTKSGTPETLQATSQRNVAGAAATRKAA